ncbi:hypothetical protein GILI108418_06735 [Gillisia limnaea]|uniref:Uncharacterized protein n=1 Tax=Gillisia limnaea (strain DSM 15749 / LMG 21470 / R-8282) TaxID=865937 RepID=H2BWV5_GILLR|nr:hypothetical protein Gilli_3531 [Gillisia limnaea DSM 15749]
MTSGEQLFTIQFIMSIRTRESIIKSEKVNKYLLSKPSDPSGNSKVIDFSKSSN